MTHAAAQAMVLAAGRGERMRPLTDHCPKPLLPVRGKPLMQWSLEALWRGGIRDALINTAWLGEQIPRFFSNEFMPQASWMLDSSLLNQEQSGPPLRLHYSAEGDDFGGALETAGGIARALPRLDDAFWVLAGDVFMPEFRFPMERLQPFRTGPMLAHLWLVPNPAHNPQGDFGLGADGRALNLPADARQPRYTYSTVALLRRALFEPPLCPIPPGNPQGLKAPLAPLLRAAMDNGAVSAELYTGPWTDVGTPQRLAEINLETPP